VYLIIGHHRFQTITFILCKMYGGACVLGDIGDADFLMQQ
jgi:hypothetical protein